MASPELLAALSQQLPYYMQRPGRPPNIGAAAVHSFLAIRTPVAMEKYRAQLRALDPSARMAFMAQMARIRADERNNYRSALVDLERTGAKRTGDALEMAKAKLQFAQSMAHDRTQASIANTNASVEMSKFATVRTDEGRKLRQKMMDDIGRTGDDIARLMNEADAADAAGDTAKAAALDNEAEARRMELAAALRRNWSAAQQGLDAGELRGLSSDITAAMGQGIAGTDPESTVAIGSIVHSVVPQMQREGITNAGSPGGSSLQGFVDFASQVIGAPPEQVANPQVVGQPPAASAGQPASPGGGVVPPPPGGQAGVTPAGANLPGVATQPGGSPQLPPGSTRQTTTRLSGSATLPGVPTEPSLEELVNRFDPSAAIGLPGDPLPATLRRQEPARPRGTRTPAGAAREPGGSLSLRDLVPRKKLKERPQVEQKPAPESLVTEDQAKKTFGADAAVQLDRRRGDITAEQAFDQTSTLGPGMRPLRAGGAPGQFNPEDLGQPSTQRANLGPPPAEKSAGKSGSGKRKPAPQMSQEEIDALVNKLAPPQSGQPDAGPQTSEQAPKDDIQDTLDTALGKRSQQPEDAPMEPSLEQLVGPSSPQPGAPNPNANPNAKPDAIASAERAAAAKRQELVAKAMESPAGKAATDAATTFASTAKEGLGKTASVVASAPRASMELASDTFPMVTEDSALGQLVGARSQDERRRQKDDAARREAEAKGPPKPNPKLRAGAGQLSLPAKGATMESDGVREPKDEAPGDTGAEPSLDQLVGGDGVVETADARRRRLEEERRRREEEARARAERG